MAYKQIDERFWKDKKVKQLSKDGYLFFLYLLTSPHTHFTGLSEMTLDYVNLDTPLKEAESKKAFKELVALKLIDYDREHEIVWIINMHRYQVKSEKQRIGAERHINSLPKSALCLKLANILNIPYRYPMDTLSQVENTLSIQEEVKEEVKEEEELPFSETLPKIPNTENEIPAELQTEDFLSTWEQWKKYRKEIKKAMKPSTEKMQLNRFVKEGVERSIEAMILSMESGWTGFVWEKVSASAPKQTRIEKLQAEEDGWENDDFEKIEEDLFQKGLVDENGNNINNY